MFGYEVEEFKLGQFKKIWRVKFIRRFKREINDQGEKIRERVCIRI